jgi:1-acyl-sn-glycerol-3-phosphate acyltransferase
MMYLRSLLFNALFYVWATVMVIAWLPALALPRRHTVRGMEVWASGNLAMLKAICGVRLEVRGRENLPAGACIVASKHQSAWDTFVYHVLLKDPSIVLKQELMWLPGYGQHARKVGMIPVDRAGGAKALKGMLRSARARADAGRPILIFPEGHRAPPDATLEFQPGVAALYKDLNLPVVPVALNSGLHWGRHKFERPPGTIVVEFQPIIPPGLERKEFMARLRDAIALRTEALVAEGRAAGPVPS